MKILKCPSSFRTFILRINISSASINRLLIERAWKILFNNVQIIFYQCYNLVCSPQLLHILRCRIPKIFNLMSCHLASPQGGKIIISYAVNVELFWLIKK